MESLHVGKTYVCMQPHVYDGVVAWLHACGRFRLSFPSSVGACCKVSGAHACLLFVSASVLAVVHVMFAHLPASSTLSQRAWRKTSRMTPTQIQMCRRTTAMAKWTRSMCLQPRSRLLDHANVVAVACTRSP